MKAPLVTPLHLPERPEVVIPPVPLAEPDFSKLAEYVKSGVNEVATKEGWGHKDFSHYIFEHAMEAVYGPGIWKWWNENNGRNL